jgi:hypothetical protein
VVISAAAARRAAGSCKLQREGREGREGHKGIARTGATKGATMRQAPDIWQLPGVDGLFCRRRFLSLFVFPSRPLRPSCPCFS